MRLSFWIALGLFGCGEKDESEGVTCEEGSIAIHGECVVGGSGWVKAPPAVAETMIPTPQRVAALAAPRVVVACPPMRRLKS